MDEEKGVADIKSAMGDLLREEGLQELGTLLRVKESWVGLVGEEAAARTKPYRLERGKLYVGVASHAWAQEMHYRVGEIKSGIKDLLGVEIEDVVVRKINLR